MYPNPQDALPLPPLPRLQDYEAAAQNLVRVCQSDDAAAFDVWATQWSERLAAERREAGAPRSGFDVKRVAPDLVRFARTTLIGDETPRCALADARLVVAR